MATDIWIHIEHKSRKTNKYVYDFEAEGERIYTLFGVLAGTRGSCEPIYDPRGLPNDITPKTLKIYKDFRADAHTPSWLTTKEFRECLNQTIKEYENGEDEIISWLKPYEIIYEYMKQKDEEGDSCRIVFWFDN